MDFSGAGRTKNVKFCAKSQLAHDQRYATEKIMDFKE